MGDAAVIEGIVGPDQAHARVVKVQGALARRKTQAVRPHKVIGDERDLLQIRETQYTPQNRVRGGVRGPEGIGKVQ